MWKHIYQYEKCPFIYLSGKNIVYQKEHCIIVSSCLLYTCHYVQTEVEMETRIIQQTLIKLSLEIQV